MSTQACNLDIRKDGDYDIIFQVNRTLAQEFQATFFSGETEYNFDFTDYNAAVLQVRTKPDFPTIILEFNTSDNSIILGNDGIFSLTKSADDMNIRFGEYVYDMYLVPIADATSKREFMRGKFTLTDDVTK